MNLIGHLIAQTWRMSSISQPVGSATWILFLITTLMLDGISLSRSDKWLLLAIIVIRAFRLGLVSDRDFKLREFMAWPWMHNVGQPIDFHLGRAFNINSIVFTILSIVLEITVSLYFLIVANDFALLFSAEMTFTIITIFIIDCFVHLPTEIIRFIAVIIKQEEYFLTIVIGQKIHYTPGINTSFHCCIPRYHFTIG